MKTKDETKYLTIGLPLYLLLNVIDILSTKYLLNLGYTELNFIMVDYVQSILLMTIIKVLGIGVFIICGWIIYRLYPKFTPLKTMPIIANLVLGIVVINNLCLIVWM